MKGILLASAMLAGSVILSPGCTHSSGGTGSASSATAPASRTPAPVSSGAVTAPPKPPHIALTPRGLSIDGKVTLLYGGEVHYFRTRDASWDVAKTWAMWEKTLDQLQATGMNLVSVYVPWEFHEESEGVLDFSGVRDLDHFLELCWKRGLLVHFRPGPYIQGEWPYGIHTFGALPEWWKNKYAGALAQAPDGSLFNFDEYFGSPFGRVASFFAPDFKAAAFHWYAAVAPILKRYIVDRPTVVMVQLDDEVNFYFHSRYSSDYGPDALAQYRGWLQAKYGTIAALNALYGTTYNQFADVLAPKQAPARPEENLAAQDWFDAGKDGLAGYLDMLRSALEASGVHEPDVLIVTNDCPHMMPNENIVAWDGPNKNRAGLNTLSGYPKMWPWSMDRPTDAPFETSFFTKRFLYANRYYRFAGQPPQVMKGVFGTELEGGMFDSPVSFLPLEIPPHTTDAVLAEFFGHGGVMASVYMFRGGINRDGERYYNTAPVDPDGNPTPRYGIVQRWGQNLLVPHAAEILGSEEVESPIALVVGSHYEIPAAGVAGDPGWIQAREAPAIYGWFEDAGFPVAILDGPGVKKGDLDRYKLVIYVDPDAAEDALAQALDDYVRRGGTLFNLMHRGDHDEKWQPRGVAPDLLANGLFSDGKLSSIDEELLGILFPDEVNFTLPNGFQGHLSSSMFLAKYDVTAGATVFASERTGSGANGKATGWLAKKGSGGVIFLGTNPARLYRDSSYYDATPADIATARAVATWAASEAGVSPILTVDEARARAIARRVEAAQGGGLLVFMASRLAQDDTATVRLLDLAALGLDPKATYTIADLVSGKPIGSATGAALQANGVPVPIEAYGTAVLRIR